MTHEQSGASPLDGLDPPARLPSTEEAEAELEDLLRRLVEGEPWPATTSEAEGIYPAWRAVERDGRDRWRLLSVERGVDDWSATAYDPAGEVLVVTGRTPSRALLGLAAAIRRST